MNKVTLIPKDKLPPQNFFGSYTVKDSKGKERSLYLNVPVVAGSKEQAQKWGFQGVVLTGCSEKCKSKCKCRKTDFRLIEFGKKDSNFREVKKDRIRKKRFTEMMMKNKNLKKSRTNKNHPLFWQLNAIWGIDQNKLLKS